MDEVIGELNIPKGHIGIMKAALIDLIEKGWDKKKLIISSKKLDKSQRQISADSTIEMTPVMFHGAETDRQVLDHLFKVAMDEEHPGIDVSGISRMNEMIESGRFSVSYYIAMWSKRLLDVNCEVSVFVISCAPVDLMCMY